MRIRVRNLFVPGSGMKKIRNGSGSKNCYLLLFQLVVRGRQVVDIYLNPVRLEVLAALRILAGDAVPASPLCEQPVAVPERHVVRGYVLREETARHTLAALAALDFSSRRGSRRPSKGEDINIIQ